MNEDKHWSIWRAERRVRAYVEAHGDDGLKEAGRRQMQHLMPGKEEWDVFTGVSAPRTEEEREMEERGKWEMEQERMREGKIGWPTEARNGGPTDTHNNGAVFPQIGAAVPASVPANPGAKKEEGGGGLVGKMAKMAFTGLMNHHTTKKKQEEKVKEYREEGVEREEEEKEEGSEGSEKGEEESSSSSSSEEEEDEDEDDNDNDNDDGNDGGDGGDE